jgi:hypothetical protein
MRARGVADAVADAVGEVVFVVAAELVVVFK